MRWIVGSSLKARGVVIALAAVVLILGVVQMRDMSRDVLPEFGPPRVEVQTEALGLSAREVEQLVTVPLEQDILNGVAFIDQIHSTTVAGLSSIELIFKAGTNLAHARQLVNERLVQAAALPNVSKPPQMLQPTSSTSRVMMIGLSSKDLKKLSLTDLGVLARWTMRPRLMGVSGVANVSVWGQRERQLQVQVDPKVLAAHHVTLDQVVSTTGNALWWSPLGRLEANTPGTGGFIDGPTQRLPIFHDSPIKTPTDLSRVTLEGTEGSAPGSGLTLNDVATVVQDHQPLIGDATVDGRTSLMLVVEKLPEANVVDVTRGLDHALDELAPGLTGVKIDRTVYRPATYVVKSTDNAITAIFVGLALVVLLLLLLLMDLRVALVSAISLAVALFGAIVVLHMRHETINSVVLAGLALALVVLVDDAVVGAGAGVIGRRLARSPHTNGVGHAADDALEDALVTRSPLGFATVILLLALLPILALKGEAGAFLPPLAYSYAVAVIVSMMVALTVAPALGMVLLANRPPRTAEPPFARFLHRAYDRVFPRFLRTPRVAYGAVAVLVLAGLVVLPFLDRSRSLLPSLKDTNLLVRWNGAPGTALGEMDRITARATTELRALPGVRDAAGHAGRAVLGDQVVGSNNGELWVALDPSAPYDKTVASVQRIIDGYPGIDHAVTTYPKERVAEELHTTGRALTVRVYGADLATLQQKANDVRNAVAKVDGVVAPRVVLPTLEPSFQVEVDLAAAQHAGVKPGDVRRAAATLLSGLEVGALFQDQKVFEVIVRGLPRTRNSLTDVENVLVDTPSGGTVRLGEVAHVRVAPAESAIRHEDVSRFIDIGADVHGRSVAKVAADVKRQLRGVRFPLEYHAAVLDDYTKDRAAHLRFFELLAGAAIGIALLLQAAFGSWRLAFVSFLTVPLALTGALVAALANGGTIALGALVGFFAVFAVATRNCVILFDRYQRVTGNRAGAERLEAIANATRERLVPIVTTAVGAALAMLPFVVFGQGAGYEITHSMAVVVLGGLITTVFVSLFVAPFVYVRFGPRPDTSTELDLAAIEEQEPHTNGEVAVMATTGNA